MSIFTDSFDSYVCDGDKITAKHGGFNFTATIHSDSDTGAPWLEHDGHGPVSEWVSREKSAGELVLISDRTSKRYYDFAEACRLALRDQWGVKGGKLDGETPRQYAARAARHDYEVLRAWCNDEWSWCGVSVTVSRNDVQLVDYFEHASWGIDLNYPDSDNSYLLEVANDLAREALEAAKAKMASLCDCEAAHA